MIKDEKKRTGAGEGIDGPTLLLSVMLVTLLLLALFSLLVLSALLGNLLVTAAIFYDRSLRRQPENLFLVSLAISDLLVSILVMVFAAANDLLGYWPFGNAYCKFWICFDITCCTASILNLCAISLDRYWHISRPMVYVRICSRRRIYYCIVIVWIISALIGVAPLGFNVGSQSESVCFMELPIGYAIGSSLLSFFLPAAVMVILYTKLYLYARRHVRSIKTQLHQATSFLIMQLASEKIREVTAASLAMSEGDRSASATLRVDRSSGGLRAPVHTSITSLRMSRWEKMSRHLPGGRKASTQLASQPPQQAHHHNHRNSVNDQKARLTLGVIMGTFLLCWIPFFVINIWRSAMHNSTPRTLEKAVTWLGYANSAANPLIYSIFNRDFRRAFKKILVDLFVCCHGGNTTICKSSNRLAIEQGDRRRSTRSSEAVENNNPGSDVPGPSSRLTPMNNNENSITLSRGRDTPEASNASLNGSINSPQL